MTKKRQALEAELGSAVRAFQRATDEMDETVAQLLGINRSEARCLDVLDEHGRMTAGELAERTGLTSGAITGIVDRLEKQGLARRVRDEADRRRVFVETTERADEVAREFYYSIAERSAREIAKFTDAQLETVIAFTRTSQDVIEAHLAWLRDRGRTDRPAAAPRRRR